MTITAQAEILPMETKIVVYTPLRNQLAELKKQNQSLVFDYESKKGNADARSYVYKLRQTKSAVESARKKEKEESLNYGRKVDAEAKEITAELESMIDVHQKVIDEIENREKLRIAGHEAALKYIQSLGEFSVLPATQEIEKRIKQFTNLAPRNWQEYEEKYNDAVKTLSGILEVRLAVSQRHDDEQAELKRLCEESAVREQKEREYKIAADAAEKARLDAERSAKETADKLAAKVKADAEAAELAIQEASERAAKAEADKLAAAAKAEKDKQLAVEAERQRAEAETKRIAAETAKREADKAHKAKIHNEILAALVTAGLTDELARITITAITKNLIPHVKISY